MALSSQRLHLSESSQSPGALREPPASQGDASLRGHLGSQPVLLLLHRFFPVTVDAILPFSKGRKRR